ncbi:hypothetical protein [Deinococcus aestuarii]|uniref:hypothetical protein n=1 Tax=Deinococcus aestuarii TaxID=2774531 RepID=UPI001C0AF24F|nr:hypothetical protein [Deinococcus aestuarii]
MNSTPLLLLVPLLLAGCNKWLPSTCAAGSIVGMIKIDSAVFSTTGTAIPTVSIRNVTLNGKPVTPWEAAGYSGSVGGQLTGIRVEEDRIACTTACSFGAPGQYSFDVSAPGAVTQKVNVIIPGRPAGGGCGGVTTGTPVVLHLKFDPEP